MVTLLKSGWPKGHHTIYIRSHRRLQSTLVPNYSTKMLRFVLLAAVACCIAEASYNYGRAAPHK